MRVLHLLHRSVPGTHGYAIRSREIVNKQVEKGLEPIVITSPSQAPMGHLDSDDCEIIDSIRYFRSCGRLLRPYTEVHDGSSVRASLRVFQNLALLRKTYSVARQYKPAVIHAHSPFTCGICGDIVGRVLGIPSVYEMRGIWEDSHTSRYGLSERSLRYRLVRFLENIALRGADHCVVISGNLLQEVVSRGIPGEKVTVVPNAVDVRMFTPGPPSEDLKRHLGLAGKLVFGYVGSFFHYEGLDVLVDAFRKLTPDYPALRLMLVGDGESTQSLRIMTSEPDLAGKVILTGKIPHDRIVDYYRMYDFLVLPRVMAREARLVTPLKPLEVMAMAKPLILSNVGGHLEMVEEGVNGLLFEAGDSESLATRCRQLLSNAQFGDDLGMSARKWVEQNRDWAVIAENYLGIYERLTSSR